MRDIFESYSDRLGGDPEDFISDLKEIKAKLNEIDTSKFGAHLSAQIIEDFIETIDYQISMTMSKYDLNESAELNENYMDERIERELDKALSSIQDTFRDLIKEKGISKEELDNNGTVYYMNGNDGTDFDWVANGRTCEFEIFYKNEMGCAKLSVFKDGSIRGYYWPDEGMGEAEEINAGKISEEAAYALACLCLQEADNKNLYDADFWDIDWDAELHTDISDLDYNEDDEIYYYVKLFNNNIEIDRSEFDDEDSACEWAQEQILNQECDEACVYVSKNDDCLYIYDLDWLEQQS